MVVVLLGRRATKKGYYQVCPKTDIDPTKASALNVVNIGGVFVVSLRILVTCYAMFKNTCNMPWFV